MEIKIVTLLYKGDIQPLSEEMAATLRPEFVKVWTFQCKPLTGETVIAVGRKLAEARIGPAFSTDSETNAVARGTFLMEALLESWDRKDDAGQPMAKSLETIQSLPPLILRQFRQRVEAGQFPTDAEVEAMKIPLDTNAASTKAPA